ncbi:DNA recombination protein RmuC [Pelagibacterium xiamenense]|uniref:DNA recombination protein RmuC n=1 Tax=Pelagibacterium xiamenense TaxID=2901140 RepID=UPI001E5061DD|nr:DNA recombination protein RmuC [Pelagibacterium xiamenense]MCD7058886.1 DNA recombination protein RmuC [Pelagibacterium xiamenense]
METVLFELGGTPITLTLALAVGLALTVVLLIVSIAVQMRGARAREDAALEDAKRTSEMERHLADLMRVQSEMTGRMQTMSEIFGTRTSDLARALTERIDASSHRVNQSMTETRTKTEETLTKLNERLAVIDRAQTNITQLSGEIVSLQSILANKQQRGAFGQGRMEAIISDGLASNAYSFQATLSNGSRPDALVHMPNDAPSLAIDAKFPLEGWQRINEAENPDAARQAMTAFRNDLGVHIKAISEKYLIAGETQDTAFMFVPSESIFADLHERFEDVVQRAARARVVIVSPSLLMLSIQVVQALLRDVRMREQAHVIQKEVSMLLADVGRLTDRVQKLQSHFTQANTDIDQILTSSGKISKRGERIEALDFEERPRLSD